MNEINVVVGFPLGKKYVDQIAAVDSRIHVEEAGLRILAEIGFPGKLKVPWIWDTTLPFDISVEDARRELDKLLSTAEILYTLGIPKELLSRAPNLKWIQSVGAGVDNMLGTGIIESPVMVTSAKSIHVISVAEWALYLMFMLAKQSIRLFTNNQHRCWERYIPMELHGKSVGVVGMGNIGGELARMAKSLGMCVLATRRSDVKQTQPDIVDVMYSRRDLSVLLSECDFVVVCLPLTPETVKIIGESELRAMKSTAYLINISRGGVIDEKALIRALKEGWIAGAGLDVFETEPLPADSDFHKLSNVIVTPHMAGATPFYHDRATPFFCENLRSYISGKPLINMVNKEKPY